MKNFLIIIPLLILCSCGGKNYTKTQVENFSYLLIKGDSANEQVFIDNSTPIVLGDDTEEYELDEGVNASKIQIKDGTHEIKIVRDGKVIIQRKFYVTPGDTFEVNL